MWVPVTKQLPKSDTSVLVWWPSDGEGGSICIGCLTHLPHIKKNELSWYIYGALTTEDEYQKEITHWMPLPKPPNLRKLTWQ